MKNKWESKNFILSDVSYIGTCKNKHLSTLHPNVFHLDAEFSKKKLPLKNSFVVLSTDRGK